MGKSTSLRTRLFCFLLMISLTCGSLTACRSEYDNDPSTENTNASEIPTTASDSTEPSESSDPVPEEALAERERFSSYTHDLFLESVLDNTVNLHYTC